MDVSSYIASGILEAYVFGEVSPQEAREVACLSQIYPEIQKEIESLQKGLEGLAMSFSQEPPLALRDKLMARIDTLEVPETAEEEDDDTAAAILPAGTAGDSPKLRPMYSRWYVQLAAGIAILLAGWWLGTTMLKPEMEKLEGQVASIEQNRDSLAAQLGAVDQQLAILTEPGNKIVDLAPQQDRANGGTMRVLFKEDACEAYFIASTLPELSADEDYQLWALVDGRPIDLGVIPRTSEGIAKMKATCKADAFAVTLEPKGGSVAPTLENLLVLGEV
ncbi:MAG: anti-sigma factor [Bacteroidia bacterium]